MLWFSAQVVHAQSQTDDPGGDESAVQEVTPETPADQGRADRPREEDLVFSGSTAGGQVGPATEAGEISAFGIWDLVRMVLVLLMVVGAVYGVVMLLRRRVGSESDDSDSPIRILASRNLGGNRDLHVVMIGKRVMLLGGGDSGVQLLTTVEDQETIDELVLAHSTAHPGQRRTFGGLLGQWINNFTVPGTQTHMPGGGSGRGSAPSSSPDAGVGAGFFQTQHDRLRHMR
ncbi:MAG: flagellar biosynthetic protein FliO [Alkalispirochaeta sp.]